MPLQYCWSDVATGMFAIILLPLLFQFVAGCTTKRCLLGGTAVPESTAHRYALGRTIISYPCVYIVHILRTQDLQNASSSQSHENTRQLPSVKNHTILHLGNIWIEFFYCYVRDIECYVRDMKENPIL